jgi:hypothetical protein
VAESGRWFRGTCLRWRRRGSSSVLALVAGRPAALRRTHPAEMTSVIAARKRLVRLGLLAAPAPVAPIAFHDARRPESGGGDGSVGGAGGTGPLGGDARAGRHAGHRGRPAASGAQVSQRLCNASSASSASEHAGPSSSATRRAASVGSIRSAAASRSPRAFAVTSGSARVSIATPVPRPSDHLGQAPLLPWSSCRRRTALIGARLVSFALDLGSEARQLIGLDESYLVVAE